MVRSVIKDLTIYNPVMAGVSVDPLTMYQGRYAAVLRERVPLTNIQKISMITWADQKAKRSKCYDLLAIAGFITGWKELQDEDAWYCSEFPYWCREEAGFSLFNEQLTFIYPSDLYRCSYFKVVAEGKL